MFNVVTIDFSVQRIKYHLDIDSKITVIRGDSGIGKIYLVDQLDAYEHFAANEQLTFDGCNAPLDIRNIDDQSLTVSSGYSVIVLPETFPFIPPKYNVLDGLSGSEKRERTRYYANLMLNEFYALMQSRSLTNPCKVIFIADEKSIYVDTHYFQNAVKAIDSLFVFVNRDPMKGIPYSSDSVKTLRYLNSVNMLISCTE